MRLSSFLIGGIGVGLLVLGGCTTFEVKEHAIAPNIAVAPKLASTKDMVHLDFGHAKTAKGTVTGTVQRGAVTIQKGALQIGKVLEANIPENLIHLESDAIHVPVNIPVDLKLNTAKGAFSATVQKGAIQFVVPQKAIEIALNINVAPGAVVVKGAEIEKGAISAPFWMFILLGLLVIWLFLTKLHRHEVTQELEAKGGVKQDNIRKLLF